MEGHNAQGDEQFQATITVRAHQSPSRHMQASAALLLLLGPEPDAVTMRGIEPRTCILARSVMHAGSTRNRRNSIDTAPWGGINVKSSMGSSDNGLLLGLGDVGHDAPLHPLQALEASQAAPSRSTPKNVWSPLKGIARGGLPLATPFKVVGVGTDDAAEGMCALVCPFEAVIGTAIAP